MKTNLKLVENIAENITNESWGAVVNDIDLIRPRSGLLYKIRACLRLDDDDVWSPASEEDARWLKAIAPTLAGEYAVGNI
ncbi:MAG: hypothetical protein JXA96_17280 [Sedimentisphaerales bacterium]|nr:hypothetical protein [Sedimentisphaerales bacterium]